MWLCEPQPKARRVYECGRASRSRRRGESVSGVVRAAAEGEASLATVRVVPPAPRASGGWRARALRPPAGPARRVGVVNSHASLVGLAPLPAGMVVVGRRVESLARVLEGLPSRPAVVALAGDLAAGGTLPGVPLQSWRDAARSRRVPVNGETRLARPPDEAAGEGVWALGPPGARRAAE